VGGFKLMGMRSVRMWASLVGLSVIAVVILDFADRLFPGDSFDGTGSYIVLGLIAFGFMRWLRVSTNAYFAKPVLGWRFIVVLIFCGNLIVVQLRGEPFHNLSIGHWIRGIVFLLAVGATEEILSRGVVFGVLRIHGLPIAVTGSSLMFGLMHINPHIGAWDPWAVYFHVLTAFSFGLFACAIMVVSRSIWVPILMHAISDAGLLFEAPPTKAESAYRISIGFWRGVLHPIPDFLTFVIPALILFWIHAGTPVPNFVKRLAIKWKLVEPETQIEV